MLQFEIALTRYNGGSKGPVVMFHGAGVSSGIFSLDTIDTNLVEYLVQHKYVVSISYWRRGHKTCTREGPSLFRYRGLHLFGGPRGQKLLALKFEMRV